MKGHKRYEHESIYVNSCKAIRKPSQKNIKTSYKYKQSK